MHTKYRNEAPTDDHSSVMPFPTACIRIGGAITAVTPVYQAQQCNPRIRARQGEISGGRGDRERVSQRSLALHTSRYLRTSRWCVFMLLLYRHVIRKACRVLGRVSRQWWLCGGDNPGSRRERERKQPGIKSILQEELHQSGGLTTGYRSTSLQCRRTTQQSAGHQVRRVKTTPQPRAPCCLCCWIVLCDALW